MPRDPIDQLSTGVAADQLRALELASHACGRLGATVDTLPGAASDFLLLRHVVRVHDGSADLAGELLVARAAHDGTDATTAEYAHQPGAEQPPLISAIEAAGLSDVLTEPVRVALNRLEAVEPRPASSLLRAAIAAGVIVSSAPASRDAQRASALVGALCLVRGGTLAEPWVAPWQLDAAARSAAVQVDRSGEWTEWVRAWCALLAREASATEKGLRAAGERLATERREAQGRHRVGGTDDEVLGWLHAHAAFTIRGASRGLGLTAPTVGTAIERLESLGYAAELTGLRRDRVWTSTTLLGLAATH
jgi:hypothetical protein